MPDVALSEIITIIRGIGKEREDPALADFEVPTHPLVLAFNMTPYQYVALSMRHHLNIPTQCILSIHPLNILSLIYLVTLPLPIGGQSGVRHC